MKPERKLEMVRREYWTCFNDRHRHPTEAGALGCCKRNPKPVKVMVPKLVNGWKRETYRALKAEVDAGASKSALAQAYGLSEYTMGQKIKTAIRWSQNPALN